MKQPMLVATLPPYVGHRADIIHHPRVDALRFNSIMPVGETKREVLQRLQQECGSKPLWIDLKGRQLRITRFAYLPFAFVELSHRIEVDLPVTVHFKDCTAEAVRIVDGNRLILADRPLRVVGAGEPVNILHPSLRIEGGLTLDDREYVAAAVGLGLHRYLVSFVESGADITELLELDGDAEIIAKIESQPGLRFVRDEYAHWQNRVRLMAARDDLYIHMGPRKPDMLAALDLIIQADPQAVVASRILTSLEEQETPALADLCDLTLMRRMGFASWMLSDGLCFRHKSFQRCMDVLDQVLDK